MVNNQIDKNYWRCLEEINYLIGIKMTKELKSIRNGLVKGIRSCMQKDDNLNV